ncbi:hypothetical protein PAHAL_5G227600 [Panicum hallii]|uniref:Uncharacterized protein n=1 Tax=Panicum hallii TaxID=206008 RepID=A0A2S3HTI1_9POAL|nr:hypothetical protein PAHAL_5G227600 [Panicum hallii]
MNQIHPPQCWERKEGWGGAASAASVVHPYFAAVESVCVYSLSAHGNWSQQCARSGTVAPP